MKCKGMGRVVEIKEEGDTEGSLCFGRGAIGEARRRRASGDREGGLAADSD